MSLKETNILVQLEQLKPSAEWAFDNAGRSETNYITHGYHRYPAKFIPNIVQKLIEDYTKLGDLVVDPFGGCGTTLVEAKVHGRKSRGFDINPVAKLITQTKITPIKPQTLDNELTKFLNRYEQAPGFLPIINNERLNYWFDDVNLKELNKIYESIKSIGNYNVRRFYFCAFSNILKNCSRWLMKSIKPTIDKDKPLTKPIDIFRFHLKFMMKRNIQFYDLLNKNGNLSTQTNFKIANSTKRLPLKNGSVDLIVTSPPYVTSYEYADLHQLSLLWFGNDRKYFKKWDRHTKDFNGFRKKFIGTSLIKGQRKYDLNSVIAEKIVSELNLSDRSLSNSVRHYFSDMNKSFREMFRILKPKAKAAIIIGDTALKGVSISNSLVAAEQMTNIGFKSVNLIKREVNNKMITPWRDGKDGRFTGLNNPNKTRAYQYEYVIIMEKP